MPQPPQPGQASAKPNPSLAVRREAWDARYRAIAGEDVDLSQADWLLPWTGRLRACGERVLDIGCGRGAHARVLTDAGFWVAGTELCRAPLLDARRIAHRAHLTEADLLGGLPFVDAAFDSAVASLSLHYFRHEQTRRIVADVRRCIRPGGLLLARFNSVRDVNHGAVGHEEVGPNCFLVGGMQKRFFDAEGLTRLFARGWAVLHLRERTVVRRAREKVLWELAAERL